MVDDEKNFEASSCLQDSAKTSSYDLASCGVARRVTLERLNRENRTDLFLSPKGVKDEESHRYESQMISKMC